MMLLSNAKKKPKVAALDFSCQEMNPTGLVITRVATLIIVSLSCDVVKHKNSPERLTETPPDCLYAKDRQPCRVMIIPHSQEGVNTGMPLRGSKIDSERFLWGEAVNTPLRAKNALESILGRYSAIRVYPLACNVP